VQDDVVEAVDRQVEPDEILVIDVGGDVDIDPGRIVEEIGLPQSSLMERELCPTLASSRALT